MINHRLNIISFRLLIPIVLASLLIATLITLVSSLHTAHATGIHNPPDAPGSISGTVTDDEGIPLGNMAVSILRKSEAYFLIRTVWTDSRGNYNIPVLGAGTYRLRFSDPANRFVTEFYVDAYRLEDAQEIIVLGNDVSGVDMKLSVGGSIAGVLSVPPDRVLGYTNVQLAARQDDETWQNIFTSYNITKAGPYKLGGLMAGIYRLCFSGNTRDLSGLNSASFSVCHEGEEAMETATPIDVLRGLATTGINFAVGGVAEVRGLVTSNDGAVLPKISVSLLTEQENSWTPIHFVETGPTGQYTITALSPGTYTLSFQDSNQTYAPQYLGGSISISQALAITIRESQTYTIAPEALSLGAKISGNVSVLGQALLNNGNVRVVRSMPEPWLEYNSNSGEILERRGNYVVGGLLPGTYQIFADGRLDGQVYSGSYGGPNSKDIISVTLGAGESITGIDFSLGQGLFESEISGGVSADDKPLANIRVELDEQADGQHISVVHTTTDAQGRYRLQGLAAGSYCLHFVDSTGFYARAKSSPHEIGFRCKRIDLMSQTVVTDVNKSLVRGGSISGSVHTLDGTPVEEVKVLVYTSVLGKWERTALQTTTDIDGKYTLLGVMPRPYRLQFVDSTGVYSSEFYGDPYEIDQATDVYVVAGEESANIDITLGPDVDPNGPKLYLPLIVHK